MKNNTCPYNIEEKKALEATRNRIDLINLLNKHTYKNGESFQLNLHEYIQKLVQYALQTGSIKETVSIKVEDILLNNETAAHIGLIIYELLTNSIKHGTKKGSEENKIFIRIHKKNRILTIRVDDSGNGLPDLNHKNKGNHTGMKLVQIIMQQYIGSVYTFNKGAQVVVFLNI